MPVVSVEEPSGERSVSGESGRPRGTTESITPQLSRLSRRAKRSGAGTGQPLPSRLPAPTQAPNELIGSATRPRQETAA